MVGPSGFGSLGFIPKDMLLAYRIDFGNETNATAPAQQVVISNPLSAAFDWTTFQLTGLGFGDLLISPPPGPQQFQTNVPHSFEGVNFDVSVEAGIDVRNGQVYATFRSIDPASGLPPAVNIGFLPPEDGTGRGMGHVSYTINAKPNLPTGTQIRNVAYISFDLLPAIATNQKDPHNPAAGIDPAKECLNTIDADSPASALGALPAGVDNEFLVGWSGNDVGSGIVNFDIYVSTNGGPWTLWLPQTASASAIFSGQKGSSYGFYSVARDGAGLTEPIPVGPDAQTTVTNVVVKTYTIAASSAPESGGTTGGGGTYADGTTAIVTATPTPGYRFVNWTTNGAPASASARYSFTVAADTVLVANFTEILLPKDALTREADYIVDCSFTEEAHHHGAVDPTNDAYGAINANRIFERGPDWVRTGESAMGAIGLMAAAKHMYASGQPIAVYDGVLSRFFGIWALARQQPCVTNSSQADYGGACQRIYYDVEGGRTGQDDVTTTATGQMLSAMWKYHEYLLATSRRAEADQWLRDSWAVANRAGRYILTMHDPAEHLVRGNSKGGHLWVSDAAMAVAGLRCLEQWAALLGDPSGAEFKSVADDVVQGIETLKDYSDRKNFFRFRDMGVGGHPPSYGDCIDQLCFLPYEADVIDPGDAFCRSVSDWWTSGSEGIWMTYPADGPADWRYFGARLRFYFDAHEDNERLSPGAGLQLAKVEWKHARRTGDAVTLERARRRLEWVFDKDYSGLWFGSTGASEAEVPNGIVDWRNWTDESVRAEGWNRFCDTSAYFIEAVLMLDASVDTSYVPEGFLRAERRQETVRISWQGSGMLQEAGDVGGPWQDITEARSPVDVQPSAVARYYRLKP